MNKTHYIGPDVHKEKTASRPMGVGSVQRLLVVARQQLNLPEVTDTPLNMD